MAVSRSLSSAWCRELLYCDPSTDCKVTSRQLISYRHAEITAGMHYTFHLSQGTSTHSRVKIRQEIYITRKKVLSHYKTKYKHNDLKACDN